MNLYYPSDRDLKYLRAAYKAALSSTHRCRHGAVVRKSSKISIGFNRQKNHPRIVWPDPNSIHAEVDAINNHSNPNRGMLYVVRLNRNLYPAYSRPCIDCMEKIDEAGIRMTVFSDPTSKTGYRTI